MATVHLLHGYLGAGKSTVATRLADEIGGVRFSADEWYLRLYRGGEPTSHLDDGLWDRMMPVLTDTWAAVARCGVDVVLDFGFWTRAGRDQARQLAHESGAETYLYNVVCDNDLARRRCMARNDAAASFLIDSAAFDDLRSKFEPLEADEPAETIDTNGTWNVGQTTPRRRTQSR